MSTEVDLLGTAVTAVADLRGVKGALGVVGDICVKIKSDPEMLRAVRACAKKQPFWPVVEPLLVALAFTIPALPEFVVSAFAEPCFWLSNAAKTALGIGQEGIWPATEEVTVRPQELDRQAADQEIWNSIGSVDALTYTPGQLHYAMHDLLAKDGRWYAAYVDVADGNLWAVRFCWVADGRRWRLRAYRAPGSGAWGQGVRLLVRDS